MSIISDASGACENSNDVPPSKVYASPGSWTTPLMNMSNNASRLINDESGLSSSTSKLNKLAL